MAVNRGVLIKIDRGLYCLPNAWEDEYLIAQHRYSRGIFSHDTALYLLELSDQAPESLYMTFPRGYNTSHPRNSSIVTKTAPKNEFRLGLMEARSPYGNRIVSYNAERTLCDMLRGTAHPDTQLFIPALKTYLSDSSRNVVKLQGYAAKLGVSKKMKSYLEVLL